MPGYRPAAEHITFGRRKGVTLGGFASWQGAVDERIDTAQANPYTGGFDANAVAGADVLLNWGPLELDGEIDWLWRRFSDGFPSRYAEGGRNPAYRAAPDYLDRVWHLRGSWTASLPRGQYLEPAFLYSRYDGDRASPVNTSGEDQVVDAGINWHQRKNGIKVSLHYLWQDGEARSLFTQGPNRRGELRQRNDYLALGVLLGI
jgi:hypothetical protein